MFHLLLLILMTWNSAQKKTSRKLFLNSFSTVAKNTMCYFYKWFGMMKFKVNCATALFTGATSPGYVLLSTLPDPLSLISSLLILVLPTVVCSLLHASYRVAVFSDWRCN